MGRLSARHGQRRDGAGLADLSESRSYPRLVQVCPLRYLAVLVEALRLTESTASFATGFDWQILRLAARDGQLCDKVGLAVRLTAGTASFATELIGGSFVWPQGTASFASGFDWLILCLAAGRHGQLTVKAAS
jgi:hypothetical protein